MIVKVIHLTSINKLMNNLEQNKTLENTSTHGSATVIGSTTIISTIITTLWGC